MADNNPSKHSGVREQQHFLSNTNHPSPPHATTVGLSKRTRGRPLGSKNKPKPPIIIRQDHEDSLKPVIIEIPIGHDIIDSLITFAHHRRVSISLLSASGSVSKITICQHVSRASVVPIQGTCRILSLTGSYSGVHLPSPDVAAFQPCSSSFGITVSGPQGQLLGGLIGGSVIAASVVIVVATVFKNHQFHRLSFINDNFVDEQDGDENNNNNNNPYVDRSGGNNNNNNNNGNAMIPNNMSGFDNVAASSGQVPNANMDVMQWNLFNPSHLPYNY